MVGDDEDVGVNDGVDGNLVDVDSLNRTVQRLAPELSALFVYTCHTIRATTSLSRSQKTQHLQGVFDYLNKEVDSICLPTDHAFFP